MVMIIGLVMNHQTPIPLKNLACSEEGGSKSHLNPLCPPSPKFKISLLYIQMPILYKKEPKSIKKKQIIDERGKIMHMMSIKDKEFKKFGEIYFSCTYPRSVKAWHLHKKMTLNYAILLGKIKLVLFDDRKNSKTKGKIQELILGPDNYFLVTVPPLIWNGFMNVGKKNSILANCSSVPYRDDEIIRRSPFDKFIPYKWLNVK